MEILKAKELELDFLSQERYICLHCDKAFKRKKIKNKELGKICTLSCFKKQFPNLLRHPPSYRWKGLHNWEEVWERYLKYWDEDD